MYVEVCLLVHVFRIPGLPGADMIHRVLQTVDIIDGFL
jgi:hypothetical protein